MIVPSPAKGQPFEMQANAINVIGWVDDPDTYPIQPKPHSLEFLRDVAHLRPRTNVIGAATRTRPSWIRTKKNRTPHRNELIGTYCPLKSTKPLKAATLQFV